jgi:phospholipid/cholesterol/gamma-HCH transport system substrate-binding protein
MIGALRKFVPWMAAAVAAILVAALVGAAVTGNGPTRTIVAEFAEAPGLFPGNHVDVLGIPVGTVTAIKPEANYVLVTMKIKSKYEIPTSAMAELMAPEVVSDRFIQLSPAYTSGPAMPDGYVIPTSRTLVPQSVDQVIGNLAKLAEELGPTGANRNGAVSALVHRLALQFGGSGPSFNRAVVSFSTVVQGLGENAPQVEAVLNGLGNLSQALGNNSSTYEQFTANLASVSQTLAADRTDIAAVLSSLQQLFGNLTRFLQADGSKLGSSIVNLDAFASQLASQQDALAKAFDLAPLSLQNLDNAIDKSAPGGPALRGRYDAVSSTAGLFNTVCGNAAVRFLVVLATGTETNPLTVATPTDTVCAVGNVVNAITPPPGAGAGPDLSLKALAS